MVHNGQEFGQSEYMPEDDSHLPPSERRVQPLPLHWSQSGDSIGQMIRQKYDLLAEIRRAIGALGRRTFTPTFTMSGGRTSAPKATVWTLTSR